MSSLTITICTYTFIQNNYTYLLILYSSFDHLFILNGIVYRRLCIFFLFQQPNWRNLINFQTLKLFYFVKYFFKNWYLLILLKLYFILFRNPSQFLKSYFKRKINIIKILFSSSVSSLQSHAGEVSYNIKILSNLYLFVNIFFYVNICHVYNWVLVLWV